MHHSYSPTGVDEAQPTSVLSMIHTSTLDSALFTAQASTIADTIMLIQILDSNPLLHFHLLQLHLIEIIRTILAKPSSQSITAQDFLPAIQFATEQLSPRAPTDPKYQTALERTMALMIFPPEKMAPEFKELLDVRLREKVASDVNEAILEAKGERAEAKIRQLVRARAWAEGQAREAKADIPPYVPIGLDAADEMNGTSAVDGDAMVS